MPQYVHIGDEVRRVVELRQSFQTSTPPEETDIAYRGSGGFSIMVVAEIIRQRSLEMARVQDDVVVQTFPSNGADESLGVWILPGTLWCRQNLLHAQRLDSQSNLSTVPAVPIADEVMRSLSVGECFYDLLCRPSPGRMLGHIEMQHLATIVFQDDQYEHYPHGNCRHG